MTPQVSVILPVYNGEPYIGAAVASILNQTFWDFELIVVDGGSTDRSLAVVDELAGGDPRVVVVRQGAASLVRQLNCGISAARGEFLARMDADDISHPERLQRQVEFLRRNPDIAVVGSAMTLIDADGARIRDIDYPQEPRDVAAFLDTGSPLGHPAVMMRRDLVRQAGGYREILQFAEDYDLWLRLDAQKHLMANLPDRLLSYRHHAKKRGCVFAFEQELHTQIARLSASARRAGLDDPLAGLTTLGLEDLDRFALCRAKREEVVFALLEPLLAASTPEELARAAEVLGFVGTRPADRGRAARKQLELARRFLAAGRFATAAGWAMRAVRTRPRALLSVVRSIGARAKRRMAPGATRAAPR
jgi:hypothetical protein